MKITDSTAAGKTLEMFSAWAWTEPGIEGVLLVGSHAASTARPESDVDLVVLTDRPSEYVSRTEWLHRFGTVVTQQVEDYGPVQSVRAYFADGGEFEFGFASPSWARTEPVDPGTWRVIQDGALILVDKQGSLRRLQTIVLGQPHDDIPYGDDWQNPTNVARWIDAADRARPWRAQLRERIAEHIGQTTRDVRVLEIGSGPGVLAERILERSPNVTAYTLLDFSLYMLAESRERLTRFTTAHFVLASFKSEHWTRNVDAPFDFVVSMQAVHELRHKRHAARLYEQLHQITAACGQLLICDHVPPDDSERSQTLYMTEEEQFGALSRAGFKDVQPMLAIDTLRLYACRKV